MQKIFVHVQKMEIFYSDISTCEARVDEVYTKQNDVTNNIK